MSSWVTKLSGITFSAIDVVLTHTNVLRELCGVICSGRDKVSPIHCVMLSIILQTDSKSN